MIVKLLKTFYSNSKIIFFTKTSHSTAASDQPVIYFPNLIVLPDRVVIVMFGLGAELMLAMV